MSAFKAALGLCGMSIAEASEFLGVSEPMLKHYSAGTRQPPHEVLAMLARLFDQIVEVSEHSLDVFERDEITPDAVQTIAIREHGSPLPAPALNSVVAMFVLTRMLDDE